MVGLFINTLPLRVNITPDAPLLTWLEELQSQLVEMRQFEYSPLSEIQRWSEVPQDLTLFESIVVFENYPSDAAKYLQRSGRQMRVLSAETVIRNNFPFTVRAVPGQQLLVEIMFESDRFDNATIDRALRHFEILLQQFVTQPETTLAALIDSLVGDDRLRQSEKEKESERSSRKKLKHIRRRAITETDARSAPTETKESELR